MPTCRHARYLLPLLYRRTVHLTSSPIQRYIPQIDRVPSTSRLQHDRQERPRPRDATPYRRLSLLRRRRRQSLVFPICPLRIFARVTHVHRARQCKPIQIKRPSAADAWQSRSSPSDDQAVAVQLTDIQTQEIRSQNGSDRLRACLPTCGPRCEIVGGCCLLLGGVVTVASGLGYGIGLLSNHFKEERISAAIKALDEEEPVSRVCQTMLRESPPSGSTGSKSRRCQRIASRLPKTRAPKSSPSLLPLLPRRAPLFSRTRHLRHPRLDEGCHGSDESRPCAVMLRICIYVCIE